MISSCQKYESMIDGDSLVSSLRVSPTKVWSFSLVGGMRGFKRLLEVSKDTDKDSMNYRLRWLKKARTILFYSVK